MKLKKYHKSGDKLLIVEYGVESTNHLYFSVTGNMGYKKKGRYTDPIYDAERNKYEFDTGGRIHDEILEVYPDMADIIALHLSDVDGTPMYALENGFYYWSQGKYDVVKSLLRLTDEQLADLMDTMHINRDREAFSKYVESQKPRWKAEADAVIAKYNLTIPKD